MSILNDQNKSIPLSVLLRVRTQMTAKRNKVNEDQGGVKMDFWGIPGSKYDFARNASNSFYS